MTVCASDVTAWSVNPPVADNQNILPPLWLATTAEAQFLTKIMKHLAWPWNSWFHLSGARRDGRDSDEAPRRE